MQLILAEPPATYLQRPRLVIDASVIAAAIFKESGAEQADAWMHGHALCAPHLLDYEIGNAALNKLRRRLASREDAAGALTDYAEVELQRFAIDAHAAFELATDYKLTVYDASYLWLAAELKAPLATFDQTLGAAATRHLGSLGES